MKIALSQINPKTADCKKNLETINKELAQTNSDVLQVFPELSLCGSPLFALSDYQDTYTTSMSCAEELSNQNKDFIFGMPIKQDGKAYNAMVFVREGQVQALSTKQNLTSFDGGFSKGGGIELIEYNQNSIAFGFLDDL